MGAMKDMITDAEYRVIGRFYNSLEEAQNVDEFEIDEETGKAYKLLSLDGYDLVKLDLEDNELVSGAILYAEVIDEENCEIAYVELPMEDKHLNQFEVYFG